MGKPVLRPEAVKARAISQLDQADLGFRTAEKLKKKKIIYYGKCQTLILINFS